MTTPASVPAPAAPASSRASYWRLWRGAPKDLLFLVAAFPVAVATFSVSIGLFSAAAGTIATFFLGLVFLVALFYVARFAGSLELSMLEWVGRPAIRRPNWNDTASGAGFWAWVKSLFGNGHYWLYSVWATFVTFVVSLVSFVIAVVWTSVALGGLTSWIWLGLIPESGPEFYISTWLGERLFGVVPVDGRVGDMILQLVLGAIFAALLPLVLRGLTWMHWGVARGMLSAFRSAELEREVATLTESRSAAVAAEGTALRRLERDIHDGPQQRLVRLQMDIAAAERQLEADPATARRLLEEARQQSKDALEELRALSRGFAPPILLDRGLVAALESLAVRSAVTVRVVSSLPDGAALPTELERNAYFIAAEGLTNAVKHSGGSAIDLRIDESDGWLVITVTDDGRGGAAAKPGHGLAGLQERVLGLGGTLDVSSPKGGPTVLVARLPLPAPARSAG